MQRTILFGFLAAAILVAGSTSFLRSAQARPAVKGVFDEKYFYDDSPMNKAYGTSSCFFCHVGNSDKKSYAPYGSAVLRALRKRLSQDELRSFSFRLRKEDPDRYKKLADQVRQALDAAEKERSNPKDPSSPTFGQLLASGKAAEVGVG